jgi:hypothetical protein
MSVFLCIPSARVDGGTIPEWRAAGYKTAIWRDVGALPIEADIRMEGEWRGYYFASNRLIEKVFATNPDCDWVVCGGDDVSPDPNKSPEDIAAECSSHFLGTEIDRRYPGLRQSNWEGIVPAHPCLKTFGVMQPTGDPWTDSLGRVIERIAGSPWVGREFARRVNQGKGGPFWERFWHVFGDECLQEVATKLGVFWQRHDLCHHHAHWGRPSPGQKMVINPVIPKFLARANSPEEWRTGKAEFERLRQSGFKECMPLL